MLHEARVTSERQLILRKPPLMPLLQIQKAPTAPLLSCRSQRSSPCLLSQLTGLVSTDEGKCSQARPTHCVHVRISLSANAAGRVYYPVYDKPPFKSPTAISIIHRGAQAPADVTGRPLVKTSDLCSTSLAWSCPNEATRFSNHEQDRASTPLLLVGGVANAISAWATAPSC